MQTVPFSVQIINQLKAPLKSIFEKSLNESTVPEVLKQPTFGAMFKQLWCNVQTRRKPETCKLHTNNICGGSWQTYGQNNKGCTCRTYVQHMTPNNIFSVA